MTTAVPSILDASVPFVDITTDAFRNDPRSVLREAMRQSPVIRTARGIEILQLDWIREVQADARMVTGGYTVMQAQATVADEPPYTKAFHENGLLVAMSGEKHARIRRVQARAFALRRVDSLRDMIGGVANGLIDRWIDRGETDIVWDFTHWFSITVLCKTIGLPVEDIALFEHDTLAVAHRNDDPEAANQGLEHLYGYVTKLVAARRETPADDLITGMIQAQATEGKLSHDELIWNIVNLMFAGHDTTRFQLALLVKTLHEQGAWEELAAHPERVPAAVLEGIRWDPIVPYPPARQASEDVEIRGLRIPRGTWVNLNMYAAARDEAAFADAYRFDIGRTGPQYDIFGNGLHYCLGFGLATAEMEEAVKALTARITGLAITSADVAAYPSALAMLGPRSLKIRFRAR